jgi:hypothetical protein
MENIKTYIDFLNEEVLHEREGINPAIYKDLKAYFMKSKSPSFKGAQDYITDNVGEWELSEEDFDEAKSLFGEK